MIFLETVYNGTIVYKYGETGLKFWCLDTQTWKSINSLLVLPENFINNKIEFECKKFKLIFRGGSIFHKIFPNREREEFVLECKDSRFDITTALEEFNV